MRSVSTGADPGAVGRYLAAALHDPRWRDCTVTHIAGGRSNLTYLVASPAGEVVLRRPPLTGVLPTAHDMAREYRVQARLRRPPCRCRRCSRSVATSACSARRST